MILAEATTVLFFVGLGLTIASHFLFKQKQPSPIQDDNPTTNVRMGGYMQLVIGRAKIAPTIAYISAPTPRGTGDFGGDFGSSYPFGVGDPGGKRQDGSGTGGQTEWVFRIWHILCIGQVGRLYKLWINGTIDPFSTEGWDPVNFPSGLDSISTGFQFFPLRGYAPSGGGRVYWGERDQPIDPAIQAALGVASRWPLACHIFWTLNVGNIKQVPLMEYEIACEPHSQLANSRSYFYRTVTDSTSIPAAPVTFNSGPLGLRNVRTLLGNGTYPLGSFTTGDVIQITGQPAQTFFNKLRAYCVIFDVRETASVGGQILWIGPEVEEIGAQVINAQPRNATIDTVALPVQNKNDGANMGHALEQIMFAKFPYGAGVSREDFDIDSLEDVAKRVGEEGERLVASIVIANGDTASPMVAALMQDMGCMISWNPVIGKYQFILIRDDQPVVVIPRSLLSSPFPQITTKHGDKPVQRIVFEYTNNARNYTTSTFHFDDDGRATEREAYKARPVRIRSSAHRDTVQLIANRRILEELPRHSIAKIIAGNAARLIFAGRPLAIDDPSVLAYQTRVDSIQYSIKAGTVTIQSIQDVFAAGSQTSELSNNGGLRQLLSTGIDGPGGSEFVDREQVDSLPDELLPRAGAPLEDDQVDFLEIPRYYRVGRQIIQLAIGRVRANDQSGNAKIHLSPDDTSYVQIANDYPLTTGGTLDSTILDTDPYEMSSTSIIVAPLGPDIAELGSFVDDDESWRLGRLIMKIDDELFYVKGVIPVPDQPTPLYYVDSPLRGRVATKKANHVVGAKVTFMVDRSIRGVTDVILQPNRSVFVKVQPIASSGNLPDLADLTAHQVFIEGVAFGPLPLINLRSGKGGAVTVSGDDTTFNWDYRNGDTVKSGAGLQGAGDPVGTAPVEGEFVFESWSGPVGTGDPVRVVPGLLTPTYKYTWADLFSDIGGGASSYSVSVKNIKSGFETDRLPLFVEIEIV